MAAWIGQNVTLVRSAVWGVLGLICFAVAVTMTWSIAHVTTALSATAPDRLELDQSAWYQLAVISDRAADAPVEVSYDYTLQDAVVVLSYDLPPGVREIAILAEDARCRSGRYPEGQELRLRYAGGYTQFEIPAAVVDAGGSLECNLAARLRQNSFTTTASAFHNDPRVDLSLFENAVLLPINLTLNTREGPFEVAASNRAVLGNSILLRPDANVVVRFHSMHMGEVRDWYILVIGVLVGFGAAMIIEAFRPAIEGIGRQKPSAP